MSPPSPFRLQTLLDLRRNAEAEAKRLYAEAAFRRAAAEHQLKELEMNWAMAKKNYLEEQTRQKQQSSPEQVSEGLARIHYLKRLASVVTQTQEAAHSFREGPMAKALGEEELARCGFSEARKDLEVVEKLEERERTLQKKRNLEREEAALEEGTEAVFGKVNPILKD